MLRKTLSLSLLLTLSLLITASAHGPSASHPCGRTLRELVEGNKRFVEGRTIHPHSNTGWRERLTAGQHPVVTVVGCSDSRVPPELLFDQGFGDLFVIRVAGNVIDLDVAASVEYGVLHTGTSVVLVLGHEGCGAVTAALHDFKSEPLSIQALLKKIVPSLQELNKDAEFATKLSQGVESNVNQSVRELLSVAPLRDKVEGGELLIKGAIYDIETGKIRVLD